MSRFRGLEAHDEAYRPRQLGMPGRNLPQLVEADALRAMAAMPAKPQGMEGSLGDFASLLLRNKWVIVLPAVLAALAAYLASGVGKPVYRARASLEIQNMNENFLNSRQLDPAAASAGPDYVQTQIKILQSRSLLDRTIGQLKQGSALSPVPAHRALPWLSGVLPAPDPVNPAVELRTADKRLTVRGSGFNRLVEVEFDSESPKLAAAFVNTLADQFIEHSIEARWDSTQRTGNWLSKQLDSLRLKLEEGERKLESYASQNKLQFYSNNAEPVAEQNLRELQTELSRAQADRISKQTRYELLASAAPESLAEVLDDPLMRDYQAKLAELTRSGVELRAQLTPEHPRVIKVQAQIDDLQKRLAGHREAILGRIRAENEAARRREVLLEGAFTAQSNTVGDLAGKAIRYNILKREVETTRQLYESMFNKVKEAGVTSALRATNIRLIDPASAPVKPVKPNLFLNTALAGLVGCMLGIVFAVNRDRHNLKLRSPADCAALLELRPLGIIPHQKRALKDRQAGLLAWTGSPSLLTGDQGGGALPMVPKRTPATESFHATLLSLVFAPDGTPPQVLVITSPGPGEGKSTVAVNLAAAAATMRRRVLLVDGDMRCPTVHETLQLGQGSGLAEILSSDSPLGHLGLAAVASQVPGLDVVPAGHLGEGVDAMQLLQSPRLGEFFSLARTEYDMVIIDTPPVLQIPDARVFGRLGDGVALVLRSDYSTQEGALAARDRLLGDGVRVLGYVLNGWHADNAMYGYRYSKYYSGKRKGAEKA